MKAILVPIDFSKNSQNALKYAMRLSSKLEARLMLFHSFYSPHASGHLSVEDANSGKKTGHELALQEMREFYQACQPDPLKPVEYITGHRELREALPKIVKENSIDLMVMGTQGSGWLEGKLFGTNTSWAIENIDCPLIAIPENENLPSIEHVAYASEYLNSDIINLQITMALAERLGADVTLVHVEPQAGMVDAQRREEFRKKFSRSADASRVRFVSLEATDVERGLEDYVKRQPVDLLVMSAQKRDFYDKFFGKSITKWMVHRLNKPILFFHHKKS